MIYGYVTDLAFRDPAMIKANLTELTLKHGYLSSEQENFYVEPFEFRDSRNTRLSTLGSILTSKTYFTIDAAKSIADVERVINSSTSHTDQIFNILETLFFRVSIPTINELDAELILNSNLPNYVAGSLKVSDGRSNVTVYDNINAPFPVLDWVQFALTIDDTDVIFKLWMNNEAFGNQYPLSTISEIVPPISADKLLNPNLISNMFQAIIDSADLSNTKLSVKIEQDGYTGYVRFPTKYIDPVKGSLYYLPFNLLYKGAAPGTMAMRQAVREYLLATGLATEDTWKAIFPDLFVTGQFFLVPMWDNITQRPTRIMYPSIISYTTIRDRVDRILSDIDEDTRHDKLELLEVAYIECIIAAVPDHLNQEELIIRDIHPTYQRYSPQQPAYSYQTTLTKQFTTYLNRAMAVAKGETTDSTLVTTTIDGKTYISFVVDSVEYHVLSYLSYISALEEG
jgi:hypothetical protein